jgi:uncharacterized protein YchJ
METPLPVTLRRGGEWGIVAPANDRARTRGVAPSREVVHEHSGAFLPRTARPSTLRALRALADVLGDTRLWMEFTIARGQLQYLNNREFVHFRSEFKDDGTHTRHLIRLWFREGGRRFYDG